MQYNSIIYLFVFSVLHSLYWLVAKGGGAACVCAHTFLCVRWQQYRCDQLCSDHGCVVTVQYRIQNKTNIQKMHTNCHCHCIHVQWAGHLQVKRHQRLLVETFKMTHFDCKADPNFAIYWGSSSNPFLTCKKLVLSTSLGQCLMHMQNSLTLYLYSAFICFIFILFYFLIISPSDFVTASVAQSSQKKSSNKASYQTRTSQVFPGFQVKQGIFKSNNIIVSVSCSQLLTGL